MRSIGIRELKARTSQVIREVRLRGREVDDDRPRRPRDRPTMAAGRVSRPGGARGPSRSLMVVFDSHPARS